MMFKSIRSQLTFSFAGIALVGAVALGAVLLVILQKYYTGLEADYLRGNAQTVGDIVTKVMASSASRDQVQSEIQSEIQNLAFLTQTRIQVFDEFKASALRFRLPSKRGRQFRRRETSHRPG